MTMKRIIDTFVTYFLVFPVITIILGFFYLYRLAVNLVLRVQLKDKFVGLLDGSDSMWAVEEPTARSVINIFIVLEKDAGHSNVNFLEGIRNMVKKRMIDSPHEKLLYKRGKRYGYYFWQKDEEIDAEDRVRWLEDEERVCDGSCGNLYNGHLTKTLQDVCNKPLPEKHSTSWEILVGKCCTKASHRYPRKMEERVKNGKIRVPILFRVHHSLADGNSLLNFFLEAIVDRESNEKSLQLEDTNARINSEDFQRILPVPQINYSDTCLIGNQVIAYSNQSEILSASMPFIHSMIYLHFGHLLQNYVETSVKYFKCLSEDDLKEEMRLLFSKKWNGLKDFLLREVYERVKSFVKTLMVILVTPVCLAQQAIRMTDDSILHGRNLSGEKVISYWLEDDFKDSLEQTLVTKIQNIKYITGARFTDVILAALSASLHKHFVQMDEDAPNSLSVIIPTRIEEPNQNELLQNSVTAGVLPLCVSKINGETAVNPTEDSKILDRLQDIKDAHERLNKSPDYMVNLLLIKHLSAVLPEKVLRPLLESHCTMAFSNLSGPQEVRILGHSVKNVAFWIPNRSKTGIGCSLLTYRGYVHLSLMADKVLIHDEKFLSQILENTVREIDDLYNRLTVSTFSKSFDGNVAAPTKEEIGVL